MGPGPAERSGCLCSLKTKKCFAPLLLRGAAARQLRIWQMWQPCLSRRPSPISRGLHCHLRQLTFTYVLSSLAAAFKAVLVARGSPSSWTISGVRRRSSLVDFVWASVLLLIRRCYKRVAAHCLRSSLSCSGCRTTYMKGVRRRAFCRF